MSIIPSEPTPTASTGSVLPTASVGAPKENPINTIAPQTNPALDSAPSLNPDHLTAVANAAPKLSPAETVAVASSSSSYTDAAVRASAVQAVKTGSKLTDLFHQLNDAQQTKLWSSVPVSFQSLMISAGYRPPTSIPQASTGGFWNDTFHILDDVRHGMSSVGSLAKQALITEPSKAFNAALKPVTSLAEGAILNAKQAGINSYEQGGSFDSLSSIAQSLNPVDILRSYASVYDGKASFAPESLMYVQRELGVTGPKLQLAQAFAKGASLQQVLTSLPESARPQAALYFQQNADFKEAVSVLSDSGLSIGQTLFGGLSPAQMQKVFPRYSKGYFARNQAAAGVIGAVGTAGMVASGNEEGAAATFADGMTLRGGLALGGAGAQLAGTGAGLVQGKTADQATQMSPYGKAINPLSGLTDGLVDWYANPLQRGLQFMHISKDVEKARVLMNAMGDSKSVEYLYKNSPNYVRFAQGVAKAATKSDEGAGLADTPNFAQMRQMGFKTDGLEQQIIKYYPEIKAGVEAGKPEDGVAKMLADNQSLINLLRGRLANSFRDSSALPYLTLPQEKIDQILGVAKERFQGNRFNIAKLGLSKSLAMMGAQPEIDTAKMLEEADPTSKLGIPVRMGRRLTNLVPKGIVDLTSPNAVTELERLLRIGGLPEKQIGAYINEFSLLGNDEAGIYAKRQMFYSSSREVMHSLGIGDTPAGADFLKKWETRQTYSPYGNDLMTDPMNPTGPKIPSALFPGQTSTEVALPNLVEMYQFSRKSRFMKLFNLGLNNSAADAFMSKFWKRAILFRMAFGFRFAAEEALNFVLRNGVMSYMKARAATSVTHAADAGRDVILGAAGKAIQASKDETLRNWAQDLAAGQHLIDLGEKAQSGSTNAINELDAHILAHALFSEVPTPLLRAALEGGDAGKIARATTKARVGVRDLAPGSDLSALKTLTEGGKEMLPERLMAVSTGARAITWLQRMQIKIAGEEVMNAAYELSKRGVLGTSMQDIIDAITAHGNVYTGDQNRIAQDVHELMKDANGQPLQIVANGGFEHVTPDDPEVYPKYAVSLGQIASEPIARAIAGALTRGGYDAQIQAAIDAMTRPDLLEKIKEEQTILDEMTARFAKKTPSEADLASYKRVQAAKDAYQEGYDAHLASMKRVAGFNATADGQTVKSGMITQDDAIRALAIRQVDHVNNLLTSDHPQEFDGEGSPIPTTGPKPILLRPGKVPVEPLRVVVGKDTVFIKETDARAPYQGVHPTELRLFRGMDNGTVVKAGEHFPNPGKTWFPSYEEAAQHAGPDGQVYHINVPLDKARADLKVSQNTPHEDYISHLVQQQKLGQVPTRSGFFETGETHFRGTVNQVPNVLADQIARGVVPGVSELRNIPHEVLPGEFVAPQLFQKASRAPGGVINDFAEHGMELMVGRPANYISRHPIFLGNYARALKTAKQGLALRGIEDFDGSLAHDIAMERAANDTVPFIHDPSQKSQFSVITRNLFPFWFAQEQFYKRWARLFAANPEAWYKLELAVGGLNHTGFVYTDQYGQAAFTYPGSEFMMNLINRVSGMGGPGVGFSTEISQLNPSTALGGIAAPGAGPLVTVPMSWAAAMFPGLVPLAQGLQGAGAPSLASQGNAFDQTLQQIMPTIVNRAYTWGKLESGQGGTESIQAPIFMSAATTAMKLLEMSGKVPTNKELKGPNGTVLQQQFLDRIASWTKTVIGLRALFGFFSPGTPNFAFNDNGLGAELSTYFQTMPYQQALQTFITLHPNALPEDVFTSTTDGLPNVPGSGSGAYVPATTQASDYINTHMPFFNTYPGLAPWTIPASAAKGLFNGTAYQQQKNLNIRSSRTLQDIYEQMKYSEGANVYYPTETLFKAAEADPTSLLTLGITQQDAMKQLGIPNGYSTTQIKQIWSKWSADFRNTHPVFSTQITVHGVDSAARRTNIMSQLQDAISAGDLPNSDWTKAIGPLMQGFAEVQQFATASKGNSGDSKQRVDNYNAFVAWGTAYVKLNPVVAPFWSGVMERAIPK